jgi:hypothetical protein
MYCDEQTIHALARCINLNRSKGPSNLTVLINKIVYFMAPEVRFYKWNLGFLVTKTTGGGQGQFYIHSSKWGERRHGNPSKNKIYQVKFLTFCMMPLHCSCEVIICPRAKCSVECKCVTQWRLLLAQFARSEEKKKKKNQQAHSVCLLTIHLTSWRLHRILMKFFMRFWNLVNVFGVLWSNYTDVLLEDLV